MNIFEFFTKSEAKESKVGKFEAQKDNLPKVLLGLFSQMGMMNPAKLTAHTTQAVSIKKKGENYIITLNSYKPPIKIEWSASMDILEFSAKLEELIAQRKKIGFINKRNLDDGLPVFQIAFA